MGWREQYDRVLRARTRVAVHYAGRTGYTTFDGGDFQRFRDDVLHCLQDIFHLRDWVMKDDTIEIDREMLRTLFVDDPVCSPAVASMQTICTPFHSYARRERT